MDNIWKELDRLDIMFKEWVKNPEKPRSMVEINKIINANKKGVK